MDSKNIMKTSEKTSRRRSFIFRRSTECEKRRRSEEDEWIIPRRLKKSFFSWIKETWHDEQSNQKYEQNERCFFSISSRIWWRACWTPTRKYQWNRVDRQVMFTCYLSSGQRKWALELTANRSISSVDSITAVKFFEENIQDSTIRRERCWTSMANGH